MAPTNRVVEQINETMTGRLLEVGHLDPIDETHIGGHRFYVGQPVVTRTNDRRLVSDDGQWVRNGDRWTVLAGTDDELCLAHRDSGDRQALPAEYIEAGHLAVDYASTIHRAQGATVDEAHLIVSEHTDAKQLYVGATRGRAANHIHTSPPAFEDEHHGVSLPTVEWSPTEAVKSALRREGTQTTALDRRRRLRDHASNSQSSDVGVASTAAEQRLAVLRIPGSPRGRTL